MRTLLASSFQIPYAMLHTPASFRRFTSKDIADAHKTTEALLALQVDSKEVVNEIFDKALAAGGRAPREAQDHGFMYDQGFEDLDGHLWNLVWVAPQA